MKPRIRGMLRSDMRAEKTLLRKAAKTLKDPPGLERVLKLRKIRNELLHLQSALGETHPEVPEVTSALLEVLEEETRSREFETLLENAAAAAISDPGFKLNGKNAYSSQGAELSRRCAPEITYIYSAWYHLPYREGAPGTLLHEMLRYYTRGQVTQLRSTSKATMTVLPKAVFYFILGEGATHAQSVKLDRYPNSRHLETTEALFDPRGDGVYRNLSNAWAAAKALETSGLG